MSDLFSSFNPGVVVFDRVLRINWISAIGVLFFLPQTFWIQKSKISKLVELVINYVEGELSSVLGKFTNPGIKLIFIRSFFFVLLINVLGLLPYVFTPSRHISFTLSLSLPLWVGYIIMRITYQFNDNIAHLVPEGTPGALIPLMVVIETIRLLIRPFTLAVRLRANIIAGHLLLSLLGGQGYLSGYFSLTLLIVGLTLLLILECAVACIQGYVFTILSRLYIRESNAKAINVY